MEAITQHRTELTLTGSAVEAQEAAVSVPGLTLWIRGVPERFRFAFGDGNEPVSTGKAGASHVYQTWGCYEIRIEVLWRGEWSLDRSEWRPISGAVVTQGSVVRPVTQIVGVLIDRNNPNPPEARVPPGATCAKPERFPLRHDPWSLGSF